MGDQPNTQIMLRHVSGAKINKIELFPLGSTKEITLGRDIGSTVAFDSPQDDVVSRRHAVIRIKSEDPLAVAIEDLNSSNGTFVNGERITGEVELLPEDTVELGSGGPKFSFDLQPRPASLSSRTRVLTPLDMTTTRVVATATISEAPTQSTTHRLPPKVGIGKNTVMMMLSEERKKTGQVWMGGMAAVLAFVIVGGAALHWHNSSTSDKARAAAEERIEQIDLKSTTALTQRLGDVTTKMGMSPGEVVNKYGNSSVLIRVSWRLFDKETGRPVFHKAWTFESNRKRMTLPAYLKMADGKIRPWLTTDDEEHKNYEIRKNTGGSGFVITDNGFILTNKHVAAGWMTKVEPERYLGTYHVEQGVVLSYGPRKRLVEEVVALKSLPANVRGWIPGEEGAMLFSAKIEPSKLKVVGAVDQVTATPSNTSTLFGKNENLEVRFPGSRLSINAVNVRHSTDADAALIKIDSPQALTPMELASDDTIKVGEKIIVLGYPALSTETFAHVTTTEHGAVRSRVEVVPEPTVTDGIVSKLGMAYKREGDTLMRGSLGDAFQLSVNSTGGGNSGGPVFNVSGKVVGLFTYGGCLDACVSYAVPIKHGRDLLNPQRN